MKKTNHSSPTVVSKYLQHKISQLALAACAATSSLLSASVSHAVHVSPNGMGQVLIYPYYTVRGAGGDTTEYYDTYISVVNATPATKALKVHVYEGRNSRRVMGFNLLLSGRDVWSAAIIRTAEGAGIISGDTSCTVPNSLFTIKNPQQVLGGPSPSLNHFKNFDYAFQRNDGGPADYDRAREGYIEIIEMGEITNTTTIDWLAPNRQGVPINCAAVSTINSDNTLGQTMTKPGGGLFGRAALVNVASGSDYSYDAIALDNWSSVVQYDVAGSAFPDLAGGGSGGTSSTSSSLMTAAGVVTDNWGSGRSAAANAVTAALMHSTVENEFNTLQGTRSNTDWVVTFPTKRFYTSDGSGAASAPFASNFNATSCQGSPGASDPMGVSYFSREGLTANPTPPIDFSLCNSANVVKFQSKSLLGGVAAKTLDPARDLVDASGAIGGPEKNRTGSVTLSATSVQRLVSPSGKTYIGLPSVGFMVEDYLNTAARPSSDSRGTTSTYGALHSHKHQVVVRE
jgi:hypothetical protein